MTDLERMLFIRARILEGKSKKRVSQELSKQIRLDNRDNNSSVRMARCYALPMPETKTARSILAYPHMVHHSRRQIPCNFPAKHTRQQIRRQGK